MLLLPASTHQVVVTLITAITTVAITIAKPQVIIAIIAIEMHQVIAFIIKKLLLSIINHHLQSLLLANN